MSTRESSQERMRELQELLQGYSAIAKNTDLEPERRYALAMSDNCLGRIKSVFKSLGMNLSIDYWGPHILGYETCIDLAESEIQQRLKSLYILHQET